MPDAQAVPARRLRQACQPWPLAFKNNCTTRAAVITARAQLAAALAPGSAPCLNGASQAGEWCVRTIQLGPGQQQVLLPQALSASFQYYAELERPSFGAQQLGGDLTSAQTPWFNTTSGQRCAPPPYSDTASIIECKPFREVSAAKENASCVDPADLQPIAIECDYTTVMCSSRRLQVANNCSMAVEVRVYGLLGGAAPSGFCINNSTSWNETCLTSAYTYPAGSANVGDSYIFEGDITSGIYLHARVPGTDLQWPGNVADPEGVFVDYTTGKRCPGPANGTCLSFFQVAMDSSDCGTVTAAHTFVCPNATCSIPRCKAPLQFNGGCLCRDCDEGYIFTGSVCESLAAVVQRQPGCMEVPFDTLNATFGDLACANWVTEAFVSEPCPAACDFQALPAQCISSVASQMLILSKGIIAPNATLPSFVEAVLQACAADEPVDVDAVAAIARDVLAPYASCGPDASAAVAKSSCRLVDDKALVSFISSGAPGCDLECYGLLKNITTDCYAEYFAGLASYQGFINSKDEATYAVLMRNLIGGFMDSCEQQVAAAASSPAPPPPLSPGQPDPGTGSSSSSSVPVAAIVGPLVGVAAAVAACAAIALALRRRRRQQRASSAGKAVDEFIYSPDGLGGSKATSSQEVSLASSGSAGMPAALASDPLVSWIMASQQGSRTRQRSGTSAARSQGSGGGSQMQAWEKSWSELKLQRVVGSGSYGQVYLAHWGTIPVAVKVLLVPGTAGANLAAPGAAQEALELALPPSALAQLEAEAGLLASLRHPCCVNFFGLTRNPPALVTEYCSRGSVAELLDRARAEPAVAAELTWRRRLGMLLDAAEGMVYLHSHKPSPIIHRDFKSPNLLVDEGWRTKVTDFGLSRAMEDTCSSVAVTNPRWLAPELMRGEHSTQASDVFAFGVVMWELLTWVRPWATTRVVAVPASTDEDTCQGGPASGTPPKEFNPWQISSAVLAGRRLEVPDPAELPGPAPSSPAAFAAYVRLMQHCWAQAPGDRPSFPEVVQTLRSMQEEEAPASSADKS